MNARNLALFVFLLSVVAFLALRPKPLTESQRIRDEIEAARQAVQKHSVKDLMRFLADEYADNEGNTKQTLRQIASAYLLQQQQVNVGVNLRKVRVLSDTREAALLGRAELHLTIVSLGGDAGRSEMDLDLDLIKRAGRWQVRRAGGVRTGAEP